MVVGVAPGRSASDRAQNHDWLWPIYEVPESRIPTEWQTVTVSTSNLVMRQLVGLSLMSYASAHDQVRCMNSARIGSRAYVVLRLSCACNAEYNNCPTKRAKKWMMTAIHARMFMCDWLPKGYDHRDVLLAVHSGLQREGEHGVEHLPTLVCLRSRQAPTQTHVRATHRPICVSIKEKLA